MQRRTGLSKSRITAFEQCPKRLWLSVYRPDLAIEDASAQARFAVGHEVGALACDLHPGGYMVSDSDGLSAAVAETQKLLADGFNRPIFEATFAYRDVLVRVDIMLPTSGGWEIAEVKSSSKVKPYHLSDIATQIWVLKACDVRVDRACIQHIDTSFVLSRDGDYAGLFALADVGKEVAALVDARAEVIDAAREILRGDEPAREMGTHCDEPFECAFKGYCGRDLPAGPEWPVWLLPDQKGGQVARAWAADGVEDLLKVPSGSMPTEKLARVHEATLTGEPWHDCEALLETTSGWAYPRIFLDFETIQFAVPRWVGTRPYQQVPFQFSAHVVAADGTMSHHEFLSIEQSDPRRACAEALSGLPVEGAVIAWNMSFERGRINELAQLFPDLAPALRSLAARLVDLLPVVRKCYYHRDMRGSWSIKAVLPTVAAELGYGGLAGVQSGSDAQAGYLEAIDPQTSRSRREELRQALVEYCRRDTEAMVVVLDRLSRPLNGA